MSYLCTKKSIKKILSVLGCAATAGALSYGLWCFRTGRTKMSQTMMRMRLVAQGFTITALVVGVVMTSGKTVK